jgi:type III pantothenate kinase
MGYRYLVIDAGNTNIELGIYKQDGTVSSWHLSSDSKRTEDEYYSVIHTLATSKGIDLAKIEICAVASVVPELTRIFTHLFDKYLSAKVVIIDGNSDLGMTYPVEDTSYIGADLIVNAYSAWKKYGTNSIICDFGTATTVQLVGAEGFFHGTVIAPGIVISSAYLFQKASLLSKIQLETPKKVLGTNTKDSLLSGIIRGHCMMTDSFIREIKKEYSHLEPIKVIATGGISHLLSKNMLELDVLDKNLTIDGLYHICLGQDIK